MPTRKTPRKYDSGDGEVAFVIERREVVASVHYDQEGDNPLKVGFGIASDYIAENANADSHISLEWHYGGGIFRAGYQPDTETH